MRYEELNRKEKDFVIDKYDQHRKFSKYLGLRPLPWVKFRKEFTRELEVRHEA